MPAPKRRPSPCAGGSSERDRDSVSGGDYGDDRHLTRSTNSVIPSAISTMRSLKGKRRIASRSTRAVTTGTRHRGKEDDMLPGISDTDCRIAEFRSRDLRATAERQRIAAQASAPESDRLVRVAV